MEDRLKTIITEWLSSTFKNPKAMPEPMISGLAEEISKHRWEIYNYVKDEYDLEDIAAVAQNRGIILTEDEEAYALYKYRKAQEYESSMEELDGIMNIIINDREN